MAVEKDQSAWLPEPPPVRPSRRDAAIDAALRRFDGIEDAAPASRERPRRSWVRTHRPQFALAMSAALVLLVGVPAALIGLRDQPSTSERHPPAVAMNERFAPAPAPAQRAPESAEVSEAPPSNPQLLDWRSATAAQVSG